MDEYPKINVVVPLIPRDGLTDYWIKIHEHLKNYVNVNIINNYNCYSKNPLYYFKLGLKARDCDLIHVQHCYCLFGNFFDKFNGIYEIFFYAAAKMFGGPKLITTIHDVTEPKGLSFIKRAYLDFINFPIKMFSDRYIIHKDHSKEQLIHQGYDSKKIVKMPYGVDILEKKFDKHEVRKRLKIPDKKTIILFGWIRADKQFHKVVECLPLLPDTQLLIIGGNRSFERNYLKFLKQSIKNNGVEDRVLFLGRAPSEKKYEWISAGDVIVLPYGKISATGVQSDGLSANIPMITSKIPEFLEMEKEWNVLKTVNVNSKTELAKAIRWAMENKKEFERRRKTYFEKNNRDEVAKMTKRLYEDVLSK